MTADPNVTFRVEFFRSDVHAEGELTRVMYSPEFVQVTYEQVRFGPEGDHIAYYDRDHAVWRILDEQDDQHRWYTDFSVCVEMEENQ